MSLHTIVCEGGAELAATCSERLHAWAQEAIDARGGAVISLAGGSTPRLLYPIWGRRPGLDWTRVALVFGDERAVPPEHPDSNFGMVREHLLAHLPGAPRVVRMAGEHPQPAAAARDYEAQLRALLGDGGRLDVALLGMGGDGHTASLFPGRPALAETTRWCVETLAPDGVNPRITLTFPLLQRARHVLFLVAGGDKAQRLRQVLREAVDPGRMPAQTLLRDDMLDVHLLLDRAAAAGLDSADGQAARHGPGERT